MIAGSFLVFLALAHHEGVSLASDSWWLYIVLAILALLLGGRKKNKEE